MNEINNFPYAHLFSIYPPFASARYKTSNGKRITTSTGVVIEPTTGGGLRLNYKTENQNVTILVFRENQYNEAIVKLDNLVLNGQIRQKEEPPHKPADFTMTESELRYL